MGAQKQPQKSKVLAPGTMLRGRYRLDLLAGSGGMAVVYRAFDTQNGDAQVAVKQLRSPDEFDDPKNFKQYEQQFGNESDFLQRLRHPNIPLYVDHFSELGKRFLVEEFIPGQTLESMCRGLGVPESMALPWLLQVCDVLGYLHGQNPPVIYRDLKPANLMLSSVDGKVKLLDFGIARTYKPGKHHDTVYMGSEPYASPEAYGLDQTDPRSDIFGWGKTAYHLLTGEEPVKGAIPDPRLRAPGLSQGIVDVIHRATDPDMMKRYQTTRALSQAVQALMPPAAVNPPVVRADAIPPPVVAPPVVSPVAAPTRACVVCGKPMRVDRNFCGACGAAQVRTEARLSFWSSSGVPAEVVIAATPYVIGRSDVADPALRPNLDLSYYDRSYVGRRHAQIDRRGLQYTITDLASTNGTYVNGARLAPNQANELHNGDRVAIGRVNLVFRLVVASLS